MSELILLLVIVDLLAKQVVLLLVCAVFRLDPVRVVRDLTGRKLT